MFMKSFKVGLLGAVTLVSLLLSACETAKPAGSDASSSVPSKSAESGSKPAAVPAVTATPAPKAVEPAPVAPVAAKVKPEQLFAEGSDLYDKGDFKGAIRKLLIARDASDEAPMVKQNSLRLLAFSYCVTNQKPLCKAQFTSLLKLTPTFQLSRGEAGHPQWGPVFKEAKLAAAGNPSKAKK
jgi:predicted small secreted protein